MALAQDLQLLAGPRVAALRIGRDEALQQTRLITPGKEDAIQPLEHRVERTPGVLAGVVLLRGEIGIVQVQMEL
jgi:hypothetical protein